MSPTLAFAIFLPLGVLAGVAHFAGLAWNTRLYTSGGPIGVAFLVHVVRLGILAGLLVLAVRHGALPLLAGTGGVLIARWIVLRPQRAPA